MSPLLVIVAPSSVLELRKLTAPPTLLVMFALEAVAPSMKSSVPELVMVVLTAEAESWNRTTPPALLSMVPTTLLLKSRNTSVPVLVMSTPTETAKLENVKVLALAKVCALDELLKTPAPVTVNGLTTVTVYATAVAAKSTVSIATAPPALVTAVVADTSKLAVPAGTPAGVQLAPLVHSPLTAP